MKKIILLILLILFSSSASFANDTYFIDFTKVLNSSKAGAEAQAKLKKKFESETIKFKKEEDEIRKEENDIIAQRKIITQTDYQKKVDILRKKVSVLQKNKQKSFSVIAKSRNDAKLSLLKAVNPIIKKYMEEKKIRIIIDKKIVVLGDVELDITNQIISILNKEAPSIKIN
jgi:Skp family chaperone for outer membrane proteins